MRDIAVLAKGSATHESDCLSFPLAEAVCPLRCLRFNPGGWKRLAPVSAMRCQCHVRAALMTNVRFSAASDRLCLRFWLVFQPSFFTKGFLPSGSTDESQFSRLLVILGLAAVGAGPGTSQPTFKTVKPDQNPNYSKLKALSLRLSPPTSKLNSTLHPKPHTRPPKPQNPKLPAGLYYVGNVVLAPAELPSVETVLSAEESGESVEEALVIR